jgi:hypothetical protein
LAGTAAVFAFSFFSADFEAGLFLPVSFDSLAAFF